MIKAIIFDMDGVLVNTEPVYEKATIDMMKNVYNIDLALRILVKTKGLRDEEEFEFYKKKYDINDSIKNLANNRKKYFFKTAEKLNIVIEGINKKLRELSNYYDLGLATSTAGEMFDFETKFFDTSLFKVIIKGSDVKEGKPNPESYITTINKLNYQPQECVVIEDSLTGVQAAKGSGAKCIGVLGSFLEKELKKAGADIVIEDMTKITKEIIEKIGEG